MNSHTFKCKTEDDANAIAYAAVRTMLANSKRKRPDDVTQCSIEEKETAVSWWNASMTPLYHYRVDKDTNLISGALNVFCQVDATLKVGSRVLYHLILSDRKKGCETRRDNEGRCVSECKS